MTFRVETTAKAEEDAEFILEWLLSHHAGETGARWFGALQDAIASLAQVSRALLAGSRELSLPIRSASAFVWHKPAHLSNLVHD